MTSLNPLHRVEKQIGETLSLHKGLERRRGEGPGRWSCSIWSAFAATRKRLGALSPRTVRRPAPARDDRHGAGQRPGDLLIADEPTTALDVTIQAQILKLLSRRCSNELGMAMLLITHDLGIVRKMADRRLRHEPGRDRRAQRCPVEHGLRNGRARTTPSACWRPNRRAGPIKPNGPGRPETVVDGRGRQGLVPDQGAACCGARSATSRRSTASRSTCAPATPWAWSARAAPARPTLGMALLRLDLAAEGRIRLPRQAITSKALTSRRSCVRCAARCRSCSRIPSARSARGFRSARSSKRACKVHGLGSRPRTSAIRRDLPGAGRRSAWRPDMPTPLPARVLRRPAPAHRHRPRVGA